MGKKAIVALTKNQREDSMCYLIMSKVTFKTGNEMCPIFKVPLELKKSKCKSFLGDN